MNNNTIYKSNSKLNLSNKNISLIESNSDKKINIKKSDKKIHFKKISNKNKYDYMDVELNNLEYKKAIKYDKRTYCQYYYSLIRNKHILFSIFVNDYNSKIIKICLFLFKFALYFVVNTLFFNDSTMHKIYENEGDYDFIYQFPLIIYSICICGIINFILQLLALSQNSILEIKREKSLKFATIKYKKLYKILTIKFICFFILSFNFFGFFGFIYHVFVLYMKILNYF